MSSGKPGPGGFAAPPAAGTPTPGVLEAPPGIAGPSGLPPGFNPALLPHDDRGTELKATVWVLLAVTTVFFVLRIYCRLLKSRKLLYEDWVLFLSYLCLVFNAAMVHIQTGMGYGRHFYDVSINNSNTMALYGLITLSVVIMGQVWSKTSFAMTLLRIVGPKAKILVWFLIITINVFMALGAIFFWVQCTPLAKAWTPLMVGGKCWDPSINTSYGIFASVYSGLSDLALSIIPWQVLMGLNLKMKEKIGVALAMSMGVFAGVGAFVKASYLHILSSPDFVYEGKDLIIWGAAETAMTITAACIPVLRVLIRDMSSRGYVKSENKSGSGPRGGPGGGISSASKIRHRSALGNHAFVKAEPSSGTTSAFSNEPEFPPQQQHPVYAADTRRGRDVEADGADSYEMMPQGRPERPGYGYAR